MMNYRFFTVIFMLLVLAISPSSLAFASTSSDSDGGNDDFLNIREATIDADSDEMSAFLETHGHIPTNGDGGAFGYGILTDEGLDAVVVSTTHAGVQDSEEQSNVSDPVWHNHYVTLGQDSDYCGNDSKVESITFESPGQVDISDNNADLTQLPASFSGTDALSGADLTIKPGTSVKDVVSFKLVPHFNDNGELEAVCVTNLQSAENIVFDNSNGNINSDSNNDDSSSSSSNDDSSSSSSNDDSSEASQGIRQSQSSTQLGVCVSGDGTFFSCNNLSDQNQANSGNNAAAQSGGSDDEDDDNGNTANQGIGQSQSSDQNALCVSGSGTFDSCNNLNAQNQQNSGNNALVQQGGSGNGGNSAIQGIGQSQSSNQGSSVISGGNTAGSENNANKQSQTNTGNNALAQQER
jgi:hypothetical protein